MKYINLKKTIPYLLPLALSACYYQGHENKNSTSVQAQYEAHANDGVLTTEEDTPVNGKLRGQYLVSAFQYVVTQAPKKGSVTLEAATGKFTYTPNPNTNGEDSFLFITLGKDNVKSNVATQKIVVAAVNDAPATYGNALVTNEDTVKDGSLQATDAEGETITYSIVSAPTSGSLVMFNAATGAFRYRPNADFIGTDSFQFKATDSKKESAVATVVIAVQPINDAPVVAPIAVNVAEDSGPVMRNITASDVDSGPTFLRFLQVGQNPQKGSLTLNQNGSFTYVPGPNENGTDTFSYYVTDGLLNSNIATATINLGAINDAPVAQNRMESTMEDVSLTGETMLATDVDGDPLTYRITVPPANGTLTPNLLTGSYTYQPNANFNGSDVFRYIATDGTADSNEATVTIAVTAFNDKPIVGDVTLNIDEDETKSGFIVGTDVETPASSLVFSRVTSGCSGPTKGQVTVNANGSYTYDPNSNATGSDTFCYRAYDGNKYSDMGTATVNIAALNDAPRASDTTFNINEDNSLSNGQLSATDVESSSLSYTIVEAGSSTAFNTPNGRVTSYSRTTGRVSYTPNANFFGTETLHFRVSDGQLDSEEAVITINVRSVNDRPVAVAASFSGVGTIAEQLQGTDVENGTAVSYRLSSAPPPPVSVVVSPTGAFTATVPPGQVGPSSFQFVVNDGNMDSASVTVNLIFQ